MQLLLPIAATAVTKRRTKGQKESAQELRSHARILLVDDEPTLLSIAAQWLKSLGHTVSCAADADEALGILAEHRFDLLLTDIVMPGSMSGLALVERCRGLYPEMAALVTTGFADGQRPRCAPAPRARQALHQGHARPGGARGARKSLTSRGAVLPQAALSHPAAPGASRPPAGRTFALPGLPRTRFHPAAPYNRPMPAAGHRALYLAIVQFVFVSTWTIYIVFLPELLQRAGLDKAWLPRIVIADQVLMAIFDLAFGIAAARGLQALRAHRTLRARDQPLSCLAFLLLPQMAATAPLLLALTGIWSSPPRRCFRSMCCFRATPPRPAGLHWRHDDAGHGRRRHDRAVAGRTTETASTRPCPLPFPAWRWQRWCCRWRRPSGPPG